MKFSVDIQHGRVEASYDIVDDGFHGAADAAKRALETFIDHGLATYRSGNVLTVSVRAAA